MKDIFALSEDVLPYSSYPPFGKRYLRAIELAIRRAWEQLQADPVEAAKLVTNDEVAISHQLRVALNGLREQRMGIVEGYNCDVFERPHLGAEFLSSQGKIRKPDLLFQLAGPPRPGVTDGMRDAIFVECKVIEAGKTALNYSTHGLKRFVDGEYAGWMREGMMLAYVRNGLKLPNPLRDVGTKPPLRTSLAWDGLISPCELTQNVPRVYMTVHQRSWAYEDGGGTPGPIQVRHLWLPIVEESSI